MSTKDCPVGSAGKHKNEYAIFARTKQGRLMAMVTSTCAMSWSPNLAYTWEQPPTHYFRPQHGHFIVKLSRNYPDIRFTGRTSTSGKHKEWEHVSFPDSRKK
jgi:hypothetical protein